MKTIFIVIAAIVALGMVGTIIGLGVALGKERSKSSGTDPDPTPDPTPVLPECSTLEEYTTTREQTIDQVKAAILMNTGAKDLLNGAISLTYGERLVSLADTLLVGEMLSAANTYPTDTGIGNREAFYIPFRMLTKGVRVDYATTLNEVMNKSCTNGTTWIDQSILDVYSKHTDFITTLNQDWTKKSSEEFKAFVLYKYNKVECSKSEFYMANYYTYSDLYTAWENVLVEITMPDIEAKLASTEQTVRDQALLDVDVIDKYAKDYADSVVGLEKGLCNSGMKTIDTTLVTDWVALQKV